MVMKAGAAHESAEVVVEGLVHPALYPLHLLRDLMYVVRPSLRMHGRPWRHA
jgi:hypothetical protein